MALEEMVLPQMGESIFEATIISWLKQVGDHIEEDEAILEVATDKVDTEVPAVHAGVLKEILVKEGEIAKVGAPIAIISTEKEEIDQELSGASGKPTNGHKHQQKQLELAEKADSGGMTEEFSGSSRFYSPLVKNIAKEEQIPLAELEKIPGTGKENRLTKKDLLAYLKSRNIGTSAQVPVNTQYEGVPPVISQDDEIIKMDRMRQMIAQRMVASKHISPHVTSVVEADMTKIVQWRQTAKKEFASKGTKLTYTPIIIEAIVKALRDFPMVNISVKDDEIIKKKDINIGVAVALPNGNLIVPVIKNADKLSLTGLAEAVEDLSKRARENQLKAEDLNGGTYTVTNIGSFGNLWGTPIIMQPQAAILAVGTIVKKPSVIESSQGDSIGIAHKMYLSHSYDHRVIDGALGGMFVKKVSDYLENFDTSRKT